MGIPFLYREVIKQNPHVITDQISSCDRLFLDFNSIIHQCANTLKHNNKNVDDNIFKAVTDYTNLIVQVCPPSQLLYIAVDGVAPIAKQHQQRKRRYLSAYTNNIIETFKKRQNIRYVHWDSNQITPGTQFMIKLNKYLREYYSGHSYPFEVYVSGSDEPGEGEHKAIHYIKDHPNGKNVIYGLDADLIMLSLTCDDTDIFLLREQEASIFKYLDISALRKSVAKYLYDSEDLQYMSDFVVICFLVGNDFLPNIAFLQLRHGALDILCNTYKNIYQQVGHLIVKDSKYHLNFNFLRKFVEALSSIEDENLKRITEVYNKTTHNHRRSPSTPLEKLMADMDDFPLRNKMTNLIDPCTNDKWRMDYYEYLLGSHKTSCTKNVCMNYIHGIIWNVDYYFNKESHINWYYKYNYAPSLQDVSKYLNTIDLDKMEVAQSYPNIQMTPDLQLLLVLPPQSMNIMKESLRPIMNDIHYGCLHYFPREFKLSTYLKYFGWECIPLLPEINIAHISQVLAQVLAQSKSK
jgi:5'-3' exonuclease